MSKSKIEWTDAVWNPVTGCSKVSAGCAHCYAEREWARLSANPATAYFGRKFNDVLCHPERLGQSLKWTKPRKIFVNSMSDLFHEQVPDEFIARVWWVMGQCAGYLDPSRHRGHTFMILTKRPERMKNWLNGWKDQETRKRWIESFGEVFDWMSGPRYWPDILDNVWLGVSVENQDAADERIPLLLQTPAAVRFISAEPLLGPVDINEEYLDGHYFTVTPDGATGEYWGPKIDWVIVGGESGPGARPMHPDWVRSLRDQSFAAGVPFFFKQWGEWITFYDRDKDDPDWANIPKEQNDIKRLNIKGGCGFHGDRVVYLKKVGKKKAGRELDGRTWDEMPEIGGQKC